MVRSSPSPCGLQPVKILLILSWSIMMITPPLAVGAAVDLEAPPEGIQSGHFLSFPYCRCDRSLSAYSLAPTVSSFGNGTYCFTLFVRACNSTCCRVDLKKIEIDANPACAVKSATVKATLNGRFTVVGPNFYKPADGPPGSTVLRLTSLGLGLDSNGTRICITLKAGANNTGGCDTLEQLCKPPTASIPPGVCRVAMFNSNNSTGACCPQSTTRLPYPPPPPPPPPPSPPSPPPPLPSPPPPVSPCTVCIHLQLIPPLLDFPPFRFSNASCQLLQQSLVGPIRAQVAALGLVMPQPFAVDPSLCTPLEVQICGAFASTADGQLLQPFLQTQIDLALGVLTDSVCPATAGYRLRAFTGPEDCLALDTGSDCEPEPEPFPYCNCNKTTNITPFYVLPAVTVQPGAANATTLYCFELGIVPDQFRVPSTCTKGLNKIEFWADEAKRRAIKGFLVTAGNSSAGALTRFVSAIWGAPGENTVRATQLNFNVDQARGAVICLELVNSVSLRDFCLGGGSGCFVSLFSDFRRDCCPVYPTSLLPSGLI